MRTLLETPINEKLVAQATPLTERIYAMHEAGLPYDELLADLAAVVEAPVTWLDVHGAFGSVSPRGFAYDLLVRSVNVPEDLSESEMLELLHHILKPEKGELRLSFWLACLARSTGDKKISDLIYWPGEYFGDGDNSRELSAVEILETASTNGRACSGA